MTKTLNLSYQYMSSFSRPKSGAYISVPKDWYTWGTWGRVNIAGMHTDVTGWKEFNMSSIHLTQNAMQDYHRLCRLDVVCVQDVFKKMRAIFT